jgi:hypothetical protein
MAYRVVWDQLALDELTEIWLRARDRTRVDEAVLRLDLALRRNPADCGESRENSMRIIFVEPLACRFSVDVLEQRALVHSVWRRKLRPL